MSLILMSGCLRRRKKTKIRGRCAEFDGRGISRSPFLLLESMTLRSVTGTELARRGYTFAAKITLWESQTVLINLILEWAHEDHFLWEWSETVYEAEDGPGKRREVSIIFFLKKNEKESFKAAFPVEGRQHLRFEPFDGELFDYYRKDGVCKHPRTP